MRQVAVVSLGLLAVVALVSAQAPPFRSTTTLVEVGAVVLDQSGHVVGGLQREDFTIREDGRPVLISTFAEIESDVPNGDAGGRSISLLLDDSASPLLTTALKRIAGLFVDRVGPDDAVAVLKLNGGACRMTNDRAELRRQIASFTPNMMALSSFSDFSVVSQPTCVECGPRVMAPPSSNRYMGVHALFSIATLSMQMRRIEHQRKTIVFIGRASLFDLRSTGTLPDGWKQAVRDSARADVSVYVIDPGGLTGRVYDGAIGFAGESGGRAFVNTNTFDRAVDQIWQEAGHYYLLGYDAPSPSGTGTHSIHVGVDRPSVEVHARRSRA